MDMVKSDEEKDFPELAITIGKGRQDLEDRESKPFLKCDLCNQKFLNGDAYLVHMQDHI